MQRPNSILLHLAGTGPSAGACWQMRQPAMPKFMPNSRRVCLRACPDLWQRFQKKLLFPKYSPLVALFSHSLSLELLAWVVPLKKGQQRCPILRKLPEFLFTYKPQMIAAKAHRIFGWCNGCILIFIFQRRIFYSLGIFYGNDGS